MCKEELGENGNPDVDSHCLQENCAQLIKQSNIDFESLPEENFDSP